MKGTPHPTLALIALLFSGLLPAVAQAPRPVAASAAAAPRSEPRVEAPAPELFDTRPAPAQPSFGGGIISSAAGDHVLSASDTLEMSIYREPDLTTRSKIASDGSVQLPLIGEVKVTGLTIREAREVIRRKYDADFLVNPQVYLNLVDFAERKFTILGQVVKPGAYSMPGGRTIDLLEAVAMAGGFTRSADKGKVIVKRTSDGGAEGAIKVNAKKLSSGSSDTFKIQPGDMINVGESWF
jgi:protein involved in polysaccharide export with SLBB domain